MSRWRFREKTVSDSKMPGLQGVYESEHIALGQDEQIIQIPANEAGGWDIFSITAVTKITEDMELYWLAGTALRFSVRNLVGASKGGWTAAGQGYQLPVTGIG